MRKILYGFLSSIIVGIIVCLKVGETSPTELGRNISLCIITLTPLFAILFYVIQHAGFPLIKDFINGNTFDKILIIVIVVLLIYVKFF